MEIVRWVAGGLLAFASLSCVWLNWRLYLQHKFPRPDYVDTGEPNAPFLSLLYGALSILILPVEISYWYLLIICIIDFGTMQFAIGVPVMLIRDALFGTRWKCPNCDWSWKTKESIGMCPNCGSAVVESTKSPAPPS